MTAIDYINFAVAILTIALGLMGWLAPRWTMEQLDLGLPVRGAWPGRDGA